MKSLTLLALLISLALAYRKSHSLRSRNRKCPDPFQKKKIITSSTNIYESPFNKTAEAWAKLGSGVYSEENLKHIKLKEPIMVNSLYNETISKNYKNT